MEKFKWQHFWVKYNFPLVRDTGVLSADIALQDLNL